MPTRLIRLPTPGLPRPGGRGAAEHDTSVYDLDSGSLRCPVIGDRFADPDKTNLGGNTVDSIDFHGAMHGRSDKASI